MHCVARRKLRAVLLPCVSQQRDAMGYVFAHSEIAFVPRRSTEAFESLVTS